MAPIPKVSVLMPVRNEARYLPQALSSLYRQTFTEWELIAVNDGSSDDTAQILTDAARLDSRIRPLHLTTSGLVPALNHGLAACRAPLVARMDGDDICHPRRFELQVEYLDAHPEVGLVATGFRHFPRTTLKPGFIAYEKWQNMLTNHDRIIADLFVESPFVHPSVMLRRCAFDSAGGYHAFDWAEDYDLWLRLSSNGVRFARLEQTLFFWRDHPERATRTMDAYSIAAFRKCKCHYLLQGYLKDTARVVIAGAGLEGRAWQRLLSEQGVDVSLWLDVDPRKTGRTLHGAPVLKPDDLPAPSAKILVAIGVRGARDVFRSWARTRGLQEGRDFICVA